MFWRGQYYIFEAFKNITDEIRADPPYTQIRKLCRAPETPGGPLALKDVLILVSFLSLASGYEKMNDHLF